MNYLYNLSGEYVEHISPVPVSVSLGVKKGQLMGLSDGEGGAFGRVRSVQLALRVPRA
ncbi:MAG: hypothetical protein AB9835_12830 [Eubacteriales bacterium]